ncbi:metallophosphoesterase [Rhizobium sp. LjRoot98]|uniref:metallophosphoesterase n=1 Tax=Rhizobium sp. LjRoot98 TaxID=3342345 RepID=UPI003ECCF723
MAKREITSGVEVPEKFTIAIGDIHGMCQVLRPLLEQLQRRYSPSESRFIFLGDLIDRGPASFRVMEDLCSFFEAQPSSVIILGNHDEYLRDCLRGDMDIAKAKRWWSNGADTTAESYAFYDSFIIQEFREAVNGAFPSHLRLLERAVPMVVTERHCFVHAGVDPKKSLADQEDRTLRWIREEFLDYREQFEKVIVHGHSITPTGLPEVFSNRIAIDTGSYKTGRITAAIFEHDVLVGFHCAELTGKDVVCRFIEAPSGKSQGLSA